MKKTVLIGLLAFMSLTMVAGCDGTSLSLSSSESSLITSENNNFKPEEGWGTYTEDFGNEYTGQFASGQYDGYGTMQYINGDLYEGTWRGGMKEGQGKMTFDTACIYIGEWQNDKMHGSGYMRWPMGDYYYGEWKNGNPNGHGTKAFLRDPTGATVASSYDLYVGEIKNGLLHGYGVMNYFFGGIFQGTYENNARVGEGTYIWEKTDNPDIIWVKFEGLFSTRYDGGGWIDGEGTMYYKDGTILTGTWQGTDLISE